MECDNCGLTSRVKALEEDVRRNQNTHKEFYGKFEALQTQHAIIDERYSQIQTTLVQIQTDLKGLMAKPGKRWESLVSTVLQWAVLAVLAAAVAIK